MSQVRATEIITEAALAGYSRALAPFVFNEPLTGGYSHIRASLLILEALFPIPPEPIMVTLTLPGFGNAIGNPSIPAALDLASRLAGVAFDVHKKPQFNTRVSESVAFNSIRSSLADYPRWNFDLPFEFLEDRTGAASSLKQLVGCFLNANGRALPFLFKDPDDYLVTDGVIATGDAATLQFDFVRAIGGFSEPVGQVDTANTVNVYFVIAETDAVPGTGPYTVTVAHAAAFSEDDGVKIGGTALTKVTGTPGPMQYAVSAGVYTFNAAQAGASAVITYGYLVAPTAYSVVMPNKLLFVSAPAAGTVVKADFQFFFTCFFDEDIQDFAKFANNLWTLQSLKFHSELLA